MTQSNIELCLKHSEYMIDGQWLGSLKKWNGVILVIGGVSGVGKTTITEALDLPTPCSITSRTRKKRKESYEFVSEKAFEEMKSKKAFATVTKYPSGQFGLLKDRWETLSSKHRVILLGMNPLSYRLLKEAYPKTFGVFITAPYEVVMQRLFERDGELDEVRVSSYENNHRSQPYYHVTYQNIGSINRAVRTLKWKLWKFRLVSALWGNKGIEKHFPTKKSETYRSKRKYKKRESRRKNEKSNEF